MKLHRKLWPFGTLAAFASAAVLISSTGSQVAKAQAEPPTCFRFEVTESSESIFSSEPSDSHEHRPTFEVWCYQSFPDSTFVFNADEDEVKPELSLLQNSNGTIVHGSLLKGNLTVHRLESVQFSPFSIPLQQPETRAESVVPFKGALQASADKVLQLLQAERSRIVSLAVVEGSQQADVPSASQPWRGYWWPLKDQPLSGSPDSPIAKFDRYVQSRTGFNPGAQNWENTRHAYRGVNWAGHCNGWAASSVLRAEPAFAKRDPQTGLVFSVADQKGLYAEKDYCAKVAFYGRRNNGRPGDDPSDIYPALFHQVLTYYIGALKKPVAVDHKNDPSVDNHIISGYKMNIQRLGPNSFFVTTTLKVHQYDRSRVEKPAKAPTYSQTFQYSLETDANGTLIGGRWNSPNNPDFLWVPLSPTTCSSNNPALTEAWINEVMNLPRK